MSLLSRLFGRAHNTAGEVEIKFHKEANYFGEHGTIVVSHRKQNLVEAPVRFVFVGLTTPPKMDLATFAKIWEAAKYQGYIPHHIETYGNENEIINTMGDRELTGPDGRTRDDVMNTSSRLDTPPVLRSGDPAKAASFSVIRREPTAEDSERIAQHFDVHAR